jgi:hypothetical protein
MSQYHKFIKDFAKSHEYVAGRRTKSGKNVIKAAAKAWKKSGNKKQSFTKHKNSKNSCPTGTRKLYLTRKDGSKSKRSRCIRHFKTLKYHKAQ